MDFLNLQVEKRLVPNFEPNRSQKTSFVVKSNILKVVATFFIIFGIKILFGASVAVGHPLQMLCFYTLGRHFRPDAIFHIFTFLPFFHAVA